MARTNYFLCIKNRSGTVEKYRLFDSTSDCVGDGIHQLIATNHRIGVIKDIATSGTENLKKLYCPIEADSAGMGPGAGKLKVRIAGSTYHAVNKTSIVTITLRRTSSTVCGQTIYTYYAQAYLTYALNVTIKVILTNGSTSYTITIPTGSTSASEISIGSGTASATIKYQLRWQTYDHYSWQAISELSGPSGTRYFQDFVEFYKNGVKVSAPALPQFAYKVGIIWGGNQRYDMTLRTDSSYTWNGRTLRNPFYSAATGWALVGNNKTCYHYYFVGSATIEWTHISTNGVYTGSGEFDYPTSTEQSGTQYSTTFSSSVSTRTLYVDTTF